MARRTDPALPSDAEVDAVLGRFAPATEDWFRGAFDRPTAAQVGAWAAIGEGQHALVVAPTGSGKTLAAFLSALDSLSRTRPPSGPDKQRRCRVLYVSPLKALAVDVDRNLRAPLAGIGQAAVRRGDEPPEITVATRTADTTPEQRRLFSRTPSDILITTPESLFLLLTSRAREALRGVDTVIIDEIHAVAGTKRGAHLAISLERLDALLEQPAQRIGLSATVRPIEDVAAYLTGGAGSRPVRIVAPVSAKTVLLEVVVPVEDMAALGEQTEDLSGSAAGGVRRTSIWPAVEERVLDLVESHRSTIVFANSRRLAERLTSRLNELATERADLPAPAPVPGRAPAELMVQAGSGTPAEDRVVARAHHGSVSREQRAVVEEQLKSGVLPAVVATSSLELGIDMGAVDLVVQIEAPPSVSSGMQRVGRAGHQVGAVSKGVFFPKHRGDLVATTVVAEQMNNGRIESLHLPRNPLDVLAQQIVAMVAMEPWPVDELATLIRRSAPFSTLPESALHSVLDMLSGRYPSDAFAELRPRIVWDRVTGELTARPGAQRLAVTSGGTIPDRGLFGVFLVGGDAERGGRRVGELDEEMVYESRVGDVFLLGSSSWRIEDITHDRVLVSPAPGQPGKMPFWKGDQQGRPLELGRAVGAFLREIGGATEAKATVRAADAGLDAWGAGNLIAYLREQRAATGHLPDDRTLLVERFRDELGDWRIVVHSPFGGQVNAPWALIIAARLRERYGVEAQAMHADDGIVLRVPETTGDDPPGGDLVVLDPEEVEAAVTAEVGGSALFASRFRECAARALLLPRRDPKRRTPLWQQRQRSAQLLGVASEYGSFPIVLEAVRECLQDVYDVPGLVELMRDIRARRVRVVDVETPKASPFAQSLLFGYIAAYLYEGDVPLAERRAQALSLDVTLLAELLGRAELRELLDPEALAEVEQSLQRLTQQRHARDAEGVADLLRILGDLTVHEVEQRGGQGEWLEWLRDQRRAIEVRLGGEVRWVAIEDSGRLRDALGTALPVGIPEAFTEPVTDPVGDLVSRYARTHGPFTVEALATRLGLGTAVVAGTLHRLSATGKVTAGEFRPDGHGEEWCEAEVLRQIRRRSLAKLRAEVEPVPAAAFARFLPAWQSIRASAEATSATTASRSRGELSGVDGVYSAIEQLAGAPVPASALESLVLPSRVRDYTPAMLDELTSQGEVVWTGAGSLSGGDGWIRVLPVDAAPFLLPVLGAADLSQHEDAVLDALTGGHASFFRSLSDDVGRALGEAIDDDVLATTMWDLLWRGRLTNDTLAPLRVRLSASPRSAQRARRTPSRTRFARPGRLRLPSMSGPPTVAGRWSVTPSPITDAPRRAQALAEILLDRYGVLTRGSVQAEDVFGGFGGVYPLLSAYEDNGRARRGYFIEHLGAAQFATPGAVDRLRTFASDSRTPQGALVLAASDPAQAYGGALAWPDSHRDDGADQDSARTGHRPGRKAGAVVVLVDGRLVLYVERGGKTLLSFSGEFSDLHQASVALADAARAGVLGKLQVERADGQTIHAPGLLSQAMEEAGFRPTPRGLRLRA